MTEVPDFIAHHGVKGMKWGVHRTEAALSRAGHRTGAALARAGHQTADFAKTGKGRAFIGSAIAVAGTAAVYGLAPQTAVSAGAGLAKIFEAHHSERFKIKEIDTDDLHKFGKPTLARTGG